MANENSTKLATYRIRIDRADYETTATFLIGAQLRELAVPDIGPERDLWLVVPGDQDKKIAQDEPVEMKHGLRLFTAPGQINPGQTKRR